MPLASDTTAPAGARPPLPRRLAAAALGAALALGLLGAAAAEPASAGSLVPKGKRVLFGVNDTGDPADFGEFTRTLDHHPALIQTFLSWNADIRGSIKRWQTARARPIVHITTADSEDLSEMLTPRAIALGRGDRYLLRLNKFFWRKRMPAYIRPLGEPNRCLNVYAAYDCEGRLKDRAHHPRWYKRAFRRIYVLVHGGGKRRAIDRRLRRAGVPPLRVRVRGLPRAPVEVVWSPLPAGSPTLPHNRPWHFYPGARWTDWAGTDLYSDNQDWRSLNGLYKMFKGKPFALTEWSVNTGDDSRFVRRLMTWMKRHRRAKMLVYYQDFGSTSSYRIQNWPSSLNVLRRALRKGPYPRYAPRFPREPPPPPGGVAPRIR